MAERAAFFHAPRQFLMKLFPTEESFFVVVGNGGRRKAAPQQTWPTPESRYVSPITIIIVSKSSNWNHFSEEIKSNRNIDRSWIRMRSNAYYVRITFESSNITKFLDFHNSLRNFSTKHADKVAHCDQVGNAS